MKLTVLGNNGPYPKAGGACSGYLMQKDDTKVLIDCGNGVLSRLQKICSVKDIDMIILSHLHSDHMSDILVLKYAIGIFKMKGLFEGSIPLYIPMKEEHNIDDMNYNDAFDIRPIIEGESIKINNLEISFKAMKHPVETYAIKVTDGEKVFVYSGDTSYHEGIVQFAKKADFFLCESGVLEVDRNEETPHLSAKQAAEVATKSGAKRLVLTHFWPEYRLDKVMDEAGEYYDSILELSHEMKAYYI